MVEEHTFEELNETTYAGDSVTAAKRGIEKYLLKGKDEIDNALITGERKSEIEELELASKMVSNVKSEKEICDNIIQILVEIHDKWVVDNEKKYDRDDERLFQHLPTALIGIEELAKDLMFLAPIMETLCYPVGKMTESERCEFIPNKEIVDAYNRYVEKYKADNSIETEEDLQDHIAHLTETYDSLKVENAPSGKEDFAKQRIAYMSDANRIALLASQVKAKNEKCFDLDAEKVSE